MKQSTLVVILLLGLAALISAGCMRRQFEPWDAPPMTYQEFSDPATFNEIKAIYSQKQIIDGEVHTVFVVEFKSGTRRKVILPTQHSIHEPDALLRRINAHNIPIYVQ